MSRQINQPINQVRLTNVAVVRYTVKGKRFEIACYRNKVLDYRAGLETDLSEVLQTDRIFTNVSKGQFAAQADLQAAFGSQENQEEIAKIILEKGKSLQVSDLERQQVAESTLTQIAVWVSHNCVHSQTGRRFTVTQIQQALRQNSFVVPAVVNNSNNKNKKNALKKTYLDAVRFLKTVLPLQRAKMELSLQYSAEAEGDVQKRLEEIGMQNLTTIILRRNTTDDDSTHSGVMQVDPSLYRRLNNLAQDIPGGRLEILQQVVMSEEGDVDLEAELQEPRAPVASNKSDDSVWEDVQDEETAALAEKLQSVRLQQQTFSADGETISSSPGPSKLTQVSSHGKHDDDNSSGSELEEEPTEQDPINSEEEEDLIQQPTPRKNERKAQQKKNRKAKRRQQQKEHMKDEQLEKEDRVEERPVVSTAVPKEPSSNNTLTGSKTCNTCGGAFANAADYRAHFRSDWHRFNQKLKLKRIPPVSEQEFALCDADTFFGNND